MFNLKALPFSPQALEPHISQKTLEFHHGKHHQAYVDNLNKLIEGTKFADLSLEEIIIQSFNQDELKGIYNNAGQVFNHDFYWQSLLLEIKEDNVPSVDLLNIVEKQFSSWDNFLAELKSAGLKQFGSGWLWLVKDKDVLKIITTANANNPLTDNLKPIFVVDVWEHAYYLDYQNRRADYLEAVLKNLVDWEKVSDRFFKN